jgi:hypothetical protein
MTSRMRLENLTQKKMDHTYDGRIVPACYAPNRKKPSRKWRCCSPESLFSGLTTWEGDTERTAASGRADTLLLL